MKIPFRFDTDEWERVSSHSERASRKGARTTGTSVQEIYVHKKTRERIVEHSVVNDKGRIIDEHFRPYYKPRKGDIEDEK
jgi:hypothetical protein